MTEGYDILNKLLKSEFRNVRSMSKESLSRGNLIYVLYLAINLITFVFDTFSKRSVKSFHLLFLWLSINMVST